MLRNKKRKWEVCFVTFASLFLVLNAGYSVALANKAQINKILNISESSSSGSGPEYFKRDYTDIDILKKHLKEVSKEVEGEGLVLLKNENNALPLNKGDKVSCFFNGSVNFNYATSGSSSANTSSYVNLKQALTNSGLDVNLDLWDYSSKDLANFKRTSKGSYYKVNEAGWNQYSDSIKSTLSDYKNVIVTISRDSGEGKDINMKNAGTIDGSYLTLSSQEEEVLTQLTLFKKAGTIEKIIVLLNSSQMIQTDFISKEGIDVDSLLWVGNVGSYGIEAVTDVLVGKINPSGKLSDTICKDNLSSPAAKSWSLNPGMVYSQIYDNCSSLNDTQKYYGVNNEGIYVGYRYYETRYYDYVTERSNTGVYSYDDDVNYPFGFGLSYTSFDYSNCLLSDTDHEYLLSVDVTNTGSVEGKDVIEVYLNKPYTNYDIENGIEKSAVELVGYSKTVNLKPGEKQSVNIKVNKEQFKTYDANNKKTYIVEDGDYQLILANSSHQATNNLLAKEGKTVSSTNGKMNEDGNSDSVFTISQNVFDDSTYSVSSHTGNKITNLFDDSDINKFNDRGDNKVTYVSRNSWESTYPSSENNLDVNDEMTVDLTSNRDYQDDGTTLPTYSQDNNLTLASLRSSDEKEVNYDNPNWDKLISQMSFEDQSELVTSCQFTTPAISSISKPASSEDDGPTGISSTKTGTSFPSEGIWASTFNTDLINELGKAFGEDVLAAGRSGIYAGGVNIHRTPFGGRNHEYFSEDPYLSGLSSQSEISGLQNKGVIAHIKHLAFNEEESNRNGIGIWLNEQEAREILLKPFEMSLSIDEGNSHAAMSSFNRIGTTWAGAHNNLQTNLLRNEWGFDGYILTDMASSNGASYMTYQDGFLNGTNCFLGSGSRTALNDFKDSPIFCNHIKESVHRILYVICNYSYCMNGYGEGDSVSVKNPWWQNTLISLESVCGCFSLICLGFYIFDFIEERKPI